MVKPARFTFYIRYPGWLEEGIGIDINGRKQKIKAEPGSFIAISRMWKDGDRVDVQLPFSLRTESMPDDEDRLALFYGPLVLAGDLGPVEDERAYDSDYVPVFITEDRDPAAWLEETTTETNVFKTIKSCEPRNIIFKPFYMTHDRRYSVYFDVFDEEKWAKYQVEYQAALEQKKKLEELTFDAFQPGEMQQERDHHLKGEKLNILEDFKNRKARGAERGGWLEFEMKLISGQPMALVFEYW